MSAADTRAKGPNPARDPAQDHPAQAASRLRDRADTLAQRLPPLLVAAERVAATVAPGLHGRRRVGTGEAFWQFRRYQPGDDTDQIDWRQSAKGDHVYVRENEWEAAQTVWLWRDAGPSMDWRSDRALPLKRDRADLLALALACLLVRGGERVGLLDGPRPLPGRTALEPLALALSRKEAAARPLPPARPLARHARLVVMGDLLAPLADIQAAVAFHAGHGVRGHLLQILDPAEETLPYEGRVEFQSVQGAADGDQRLLVPRVDGLRAAYQERLAAHRAGLAQIARAQGWSFSLHHTDKPPQAALLGLWGALSQESLRSATAHAGVTHMSGGDA
ncbi:DUF58 domain-containing protein [Nitrospirillum iridis]|uniref:Uncharacterized protein (DUF58 family) n=1 Tax=Nitrospirillum iridis TaxID=765888 RepID=A0A7X0EAS0_9PROT|nr:DUF58 domain-containing protein [Nitrospirillum iridis]MBB6249778.1 uncharacterized protein (DUF58 family) [Nitrospirillum iridis]